MRQGQRCQCVHGVVAATDAQRIGRHQALYKNIIGHTLVALVAGTVAIVLRAYQPRHAVDHLQPEITWLARHIHTKAEVRAQLRALELDAHWWWQHRHHYGIIPVQHHQPTLPKHLGFGGGVGLHAAVPIQMVLRDVEHGGGCRLKRMGVF